jgi:chemotaxis protein methyltransferase WspC
MDLTEITQLLLQRIGLDHGTIGEKSIELGVEARLRALRLHDSAAYVQRLMIDPGELQALTEEVVVPETWFFRGLDQLRFSAEVGRQWRPAFPGQTLQVLSVPCSTGEEPYSIYMFLRHFGLEPSQFRIVAVDISQRFIDRAIRGAYSNLSFRETAPLCDVLRLRYFEPEAPGTVIPEVRNAIQFRRDNLISPTFLADCGPFDLIFCRNVLIYFDQPSRRIALQALRSLLSPNGHLFAGHAEPLPLFDPQFKSVGPPGAFAFQRKEAAATAAVQKSTAASVRRSATQAPPVLPTFQSAFAPPPTPVPDQNVRETTTAGSHVAREPLPSGDLLISAEQAANSGQLRNARHLCERHLEQHGPTAAALCLLGVLQQAAGELADAERSFQRAVYLDPAHTDSLWNLRLLAEKRGDQRAVETFQRRLARAEATPG